MLLVEGERLLGPVELEPEPVLASSGDLADDDRPNCAARRSRTGRARRLRSSPGAARCRPLLSRTHDLPRWLAPARRSAGAPRRARCDGRKRTRRGRTSASRCRRTRATRRRAVRPRASWRRRRGEASPGGTCRAAGEAHRSARWRRVRAPHALSGSSGRQTARLSVVPTLPRRRRAVGHRQRRARAASRRSRASPLPAQPRRAASEGGSACRRGRRRRPGRRPALRPMRSGARRRARRPPLEPTPAWRRRRRPAVLPRVEPTVRAPCR